METESRSPNLNQPRSQSFDNPTTEKKKIKCCFSQINDLTTTIDFKDNDPDPYKSKFETRRSKQPRSPNCECIITVLLKLYSVF